MSFKPLLVNSFTRHQPIQPWPNQQPAQQESAITYDAVTYKDRFGNSVKKEHAEARCMTVTHWLVAIGSLLAGGYIVYRFGKG
jgi:hypothetical protein